MHVQPFEMERYQSLWEHIVEYNLSESGVHPLKLNELVSAEQLNEIVQTSLGYNQTNGSEELRSLIAQLYSGANIKNILVTNGSSEANFISTWRLIEPGDEVAIMLPNYMQIWGIAQAFGAEVKPFHLIPKNNRWQINWDEFENAVSLRTKLIAVCNPNNPTGAQLNSGEINRICETAAKAGAWILSDEVYRGAERVGETTPTFWGNYDRVIVTCGLSKAYGLPGLRIGWLVAPPELVSELWGYHDYTTICPNPLSDKLACIALQHPQREKIIKRTRNIVKINFEIVLEWLKYHNEMFNCIPPVAGAITLIEHNLNIRSKDFIIRLRDEKSVLVVSGEQFLMENFLRIGFGSPPEYLKAALNRVSELIAEIT